MAAIHGCGIGHKYFARYTNCQQKIEILQCSLNNDYNSFKRKEGFGRSYIGSGKAFHELITRLK